MKLRHPFFAHLSNRLFIYLRIEGQIVTDNWPWVFVCLFCFHTHFISVPENLRPTKEKCHNTYLRGRKKKKHIFALKIKTKQKKNTLKSDCNNLEDCNDQDLLL